MTIFFQDTKSDVADNNNTSVQPEAQIMEGEKDEKSEEPMKDEGITKDEGTRRETTEDVSNEVTMEDVDRETVCL